MRSAALEGRRPGRSSFEARKSAHLRMTEKTIKLEFIKL
jgi:hypothetical protein